METLEGNACCLVDVGGGRAVGHWDMLFRFGRISLGDSVGVGIVVSLNRHISMVSIQRLRLRGLSAVARDFAAGDGVDGV